MAQPKCCVYNKNDGDISPYNLWNTDIVAIITFFNVDDERNDNVISIPSFCCTLRVLSRVFKLFLTFMFLYSLVESQGWGGGYVKMSSNL